MTSRKDDGIEQGLDFLSAVDPDGTFDAALLIARTGSIIAGWMRESDQCEAVGVMTATLIASINTIVEMVGRRTPTEVFVKCEDSQILATRTGDNTILVLIAPDVTKSSHIRRKSRQIATYLAQRNRSDQTETFAIPGTATPSLVGRGLQSASQQPR